MIGDGQELSSSTPPPLIFIPYVSLFLLDNMRMYTQLWTFSFDWVSCDCWKCDCVPSVGLWECLAGWYSQYYEYAIISKILPTLPDGENNAMSSLLSSGLSSLISLYIHSVLSFCCQGSPWGGSRDKFYCNVTKLIQLTACWR